MTTGSAVPEVILFDLGGVLMDFAGLQRLADLCGEPNSPDLRSRWAASPWLQAFERGHCDAEAFCAGIVADWDLDLTPNEFLVEFRSWPKGPFDGALDVLRSLHGRIQIGCLSNTNPIHWQLHLERWGVVQYFDRTFVSHELGMMKPDPEIYRYVVQRFGIAPQRVLFLDDSKDNVVAAREVGMKAEHVCGIEEVRHALSREYADWVH